jgi:UDP-glucose 4-epimerase
MTRVICTGSCGFIGSHVVDLLLKEGHQVWCLDDLSSGKRENLPDKIEFAKVDVGNWWDLVAEFVDCEPEVVIHLAAQPSICDSIDNPIRDGFVNVMGTLNIIRASQKIGVKRLIFSSTSAVYASIYTDLPIPEDFPRFPESPYGISKLAAESYIRNLMPENSVVLRLGNVYGPRQVPLGQNQLIPRMIKHFENGDEFFIHGDGEHKRDFVYVEDVARAVLLAIDGKPDVYNIACGNAVAVNCVATMLEEIYEVPGYAWQHDDQPDPREKIELSIWKAKEGLGWEPSVDLKTGLQKTVKWWKK